VTRSLAAVPSISEVEHACSQVLTLFREVHSFAYDAGGQSNVRRSQTNDPTGDVAVNGLGDTDETKRMGARDSLARAASQLDHAVTTLLGAIRMEQRSSTVATSQSWSVADAEDVSAEYAQRKHRGQQHARSVGA
jgi:hypothetical protein